MIIENNSQKDIINKIKTTSFYNKYINRLYVNMDDPYIYYFKTDKIYSQLEADECNNELFFNGKYILYVLLDIAYADNKDIIKEVK